MAKYARSECEITIFDKNTVFGSQYIILWNENTQTIWIKFNISEFFWHFLLLVLHCMSCNAGTLIDDQLLNVQKLNSIFFYSNETNKVSTKKVDQFFHFNDGLGNKICFIW